MILVQKSVMVFTFLFKQALWCSSPFFRHTLELWGPKCRTKLDSLPKVTLLYLYCSMLSCPSLLQLLLLLLGGENEQAECDFSSLFPPVRNASVLGSLDSSLLPPEGQVIHRGKSALADEVPQFVVVLSVVDCLQPQPSFHKTFNTIYREHPTCAAISFWRTPLCFRAIITVTAIWDIRFYTHVYDYNASTIWSIEHRFSKHTNIFRFSDFFQNDEFCLTYHSKLIFQDTFKNFAHIYKNTIRSCSFSVKKLVIVKNIELLIFWLESLYVMSFLQ